jgi:uncharacterized membrane protein YgcG
MRDVCKLLLCVFFSVVFLNTSIAFAQSDSSSQKKSFFRASTYYLSNAVYSGRKDSLRVPYIKTAISYIHKSGLSVSAGASTLVASTSPTRVDAVWLDAGYDFSIGEKINGGVDVTKTFYSNASFAVTSEIKAEGGAYLGYDAGPVSINTSAYVMYSQAADISVSLGLSHAFDFGPENKQWTIEPDASVGMGTQNFYEAYVQNRKSSTSGSGRGHSKKNGSGSGSSSGSGSTTTQTVSFNQKSSFKILDYELTVPVTYNGKGWRVYAKPVYAMPVNPASYTINNRVQKEKLSNTFFFEVGGRVDF